MNGSWSEESIDQTRDVQVLGENLSEEITGKVIARFSLSELSDEEAVLVDTTCGKQVLCRLTEFSEKERVVSGDIVSIAEERRGGADEVLERFVKEEGELFSKERFLEFVKRRELFLSADKKELGERFQTRVKTLARLGIATDQGGGSYELPGGHL